MIDNFHLQNFKGIPATAHDPYFSKKGYLPNHPREYGEHPPYDSCSDTIYIGNRIPLYWAHTHRELEVQYIVSGESHAILNGVDTVLKAGDMLIVNPFDDHQGYTIISEEPLYYYFTIIDLSFFAQSLPFSASKVIKDIHRGAARFRSCINQRALDNISLEALFRRLHDDYTDGHECSMVAAIYELLTLLIEHCVAKDEASQPNPDFEFICRVSDIIDQRYATDLSTASVSDELSYSKSYFCRRFRECFGMPFLDYLCRYRLQCATRMRVDKDTTLTDIASRVGFNDYAYFSRSFRKFTGMNPKQYFIG